MLQVEEFNAALNEYEVLELVGRGGMGAVYRARQLDLDREVAIKLLAPDAGADLEFTARFTREAQVTASLDHTGIVPVYGVGYDACGRCYYTMRTVRGRELGEVFRSWSLARSGAVLMRVCQAIAFAHERGVVHRDLKPSNIMAGDLGEGYLMDWELAKTVGMANTRDIRLVGNTGADSPLVTMDGSVIGTPAYMPPEQAQSRVEEVDHLSDIYSLGAILYQLLAGHPPYSPADSATTPAQVLQALSVEPPKQVRREKSKAPAELIAVCEKAMARERTASYTTALALADNLHAWPEGRVVGAHGPARSSPHASGGGETVCSRCSRHSAPVLLSPCNFSLSFAVEKEREARTAALATLADAHVSAGLQAKSPDEAALFFDCAAAIAPDAEAQLTNRIRVREWSRLVTRIVRAFNAGGRPDELLSTPRGAVCASTFVAMCGCMMSPRSGA